MIVMLGSHLFKHCLFHTRSNKFTRPDPAFDIKTSQIISKPDLFTGEYLQTQTSILKQLFMICRRIEGQAVITVKFQDLVGTFSFLLDIGILNRCVSVVKRF